MRTGALRYCYEKKKFFKLCVSQGQNYYAQGFGKLFTRYWIFKNGTLTIKVKVDRLESVVWFFKGFGKIFLDGYGHWMSRIKRVIRINQLSQTKIYSQSYVNKSITALFKMLGIYGMPRKISSKATYKFAHFSTTGSFHRD